MARAILCLAGLLYAAPTFAQASYIAGGVGVDVFRPTHSEIRGSGDASAGGEAVALAVRAGTAITDRWGVELEVARGGAIEREERQGLPVPLRTLIPDFLAPFLETTIRTSRRHTTVDAVAWVAHTISGRVDLVYLGGVAFTRSHEEQQFEIRRRAETAGIVVPNATRAVTYGAGPVAGVEARVALTTRTQLVPGVRLHSTGGESGGWLLRPSIALGWRF